MRIQSLFEQVQQINSLFVESTSLQQALVEFVKELESKSIDFALCGGLALGLYVRPRGTLDVDLAFKSESDITAIRDVTGFKKHRAHAYEHKSSGVEIELITAQFVGQSQYQSVFDRAIREAKIESVSGVNVPVVTPSGLVALKLLRWSRQDQADIESLLKSQEIDVKDYGLSSSHLNKLKSIRDELSL